MKAGDSQPGALNPRNNNFDILRLWGAILVLYSHTYSVCFASYASEPLSYLSGMQISFGAVGLYIFFVISGFLVTGSWVRSPSAKIFLRKRIVRIFPALILAVVAVLLLVVPFFNSYSFTEYFSQKETWTYLKNISLYRTQFDLPGAFPHNPTPFITNSNLWTLSYEFSMYFLTALLGVLFFFRRKVGVVVLFVGLYLLFAWKGDALKDVRLPWVGHELKPLLRLSLYYLAGTLFYLYREKWRNKVRFAWLVIVLPIWILSLGMGLSDWLSPILLPCMVVLIAYAPVRIAPGLIRLGDSSYGFYLWAIPVQQMAVALLGPNFGLVFGVSLLGSYAMGLISWHFVERRFLHR